MSNQLKLPILSQARGTVTLPGSKSISNRVLLLAALCSGTTLVRSLLESDDTAVMLTALKTLGVNWVREGDSNDYLVHGVAGIFPQKKARLAMGNAGTAIRPLAAALALQGGDYHLSGVERMHERPIGDLVDGLRQIGAAITYLENSGYPPLQIGTGQIEINRPIVIRGATSSQFLTALLLALPLLNRYRRADSVAPLSIEIEGELISKPYIALTLNLLARFGVEVENDNWSRFLLPANTYYQSPGEILVEGDASSASYFLAAGMLGGGPVRVLGVGRNSIQGDVQFAYALEKMGAVINIGDDWIEASAPVGRPLQALDMDCNQIPDAAMTLAVCALFAVGTTTLRNIASWRVKETDRIAAMCKELRKLGATVIEYPDAISITGVTGIANIVGNTDATAITDVSAQSTWQTPLGGIDTYDDHRMAMCFSLAAFSPVPITINDPQCVAKTFPDYFSVFARLTERLGR